MRERAFTLVEMMATILVLGLAASFVGPLMVELSRGAAFQKDARRELWETNHALERIADLVRTAPEGMGQSSGLSEVSATHFTRHDGRGVRFENGSVYVFDDDGESLLADNFAQDFELRVLAKDGVTDASETPEDAWRAELGVDVGMGMVRTAISLARPAPEDEGSALVAAYAFGQNDWTRPVPNEPGRDYIKVVQYGANYLYDEARGYGYTDVDGIDDSPNNRGRYSGPDEIYDQFIGTKWQVGNEIVFRMDVPNGDYRIVLAGGDPSYDHTTRLIVRDGSNTDTQLTLIQDVYHDRGEFFQIGFKGHAVPAPDGSGAQPTFFPEVLSPTLTVTEGYIELSKVDSGSNGGCVCLIEIWRATGEISPSINFNGYTLHPFGKEDGAFDRDTVAEIQDGGYTLYLYGNAWKAIQFPYTVTENTVLEFEYASTSEGEFVGIQTAEDMQLVVDARGVQTWGTLPLFAIAPPAVEEYNGSGRYTTYRVKLKDMNPLYPLGDIAYLVFVNNDDVGAYSESYFRNVTVYEDE